MAIVLIIFYCVDTLSCNEPQLPCDYKLRSLGFTKPRDTKEINTRRKTLPIYQLVANADHRLKLSVLRKLSSASAIQWLF